MRKLINEVHRRSLWQVLGIYLAASWIALQVVSQLAESVGLPEWVEPFAVVLLVIGLPIVLATAFVQEGTSGRGAMAGEGASSAEPGAVAPSAAAAATVAYPDTAGGPAGTGAEPVGAASAPGATRRLLTWRNALAGGGVAFLFLAVVTVGWMAMRAAGIGPAGSLVARGVLDERAPVIVSDFSAPDSLLARAATEAFRVDLSQSPAVQVLEPSFLAEALGRMQVPRDARLDAKLARELAVREGIPAVVVGEITPAGRGFVLTARLVDADDGAALTSQRETAADTADVLRALDRLSKSLRERIGESYLSLRADPPLAKVTTSSLQALKLYSEALRTFELQGDSDRGIALLEEAVGIDPGFAMAWRKLGVERRNKFQSAALVNEALTRAFENRDRLTERERHLAAGSYFTTVTAEYPKAIAEYERLLDRDPGDAWALNNVAILYGSLRDRERALSHIERAFAADSSAYTAYTNLAIEQYRSTGDLDSAAAIVARAQARFPGNAAVELWESRYAALRGNYALADSLLRVVASAHRDNPGAQLDVASLTAVLAAARGRLRDHERHLREYVDLALAHDEPEDVLSAGNWLAYTRLFAAGDTAGARAAIARATAIVDPEDLPFADRDYPTQAELRALLGQPDRARSLLGRFESEAGPDLARVEENAVLRARGAIALAEGDPEEAARLYARSDRGPCEICAKLGTALAWDRAGRADSALAWYEAYLETRQPNRMYWDQAGLGFSLGRAAGLADEIGDPEKAALYYAELVELWKDADAELQPQVERARARLEEILRQRG
ncbi:MAG: hypothetical protein R6X22_00980 [Gemmatimonadota bacterium]